MRQGLSILGLVLITLAGVFFAGGGLPPQEIQVKTEDGIPVVYNPKEPVKIKGLPSKVTLKEDLTIGKDTENPNYMFSRLRYCRVDDEEYMVIVDAKECQIKVYDRDGKHFRSFGSKGQGPGEIGFLYYLAIFQGNKIVVYDQTNAKVIFFSREGKLLKEVPSGKHRGLRKFEMDSEGCFYATSITFDEAKMLFDLRRFSPTLEPLATFAASELSMQPQVGWAFWPELSVQITRDENLVWLNPFNYELTLVNREGRALRKIIKDCDPVEITEAHKKRLIRQDWGDRGVRPGIKYKIPRHFPPISAFYVDGEDRIYVRTYDYIMKDGIQLDRYDVFDPEGRYFAKFYHPRSETAQVFRKDKMYVRVEEEAYGMDLLRRYSLIWE